MFQKRNVGKKKSQPVNPKVREQVLNPKAAGLTGKDKPYAILISSPFDKEDSAVDFQAIKKFTETRGCSALNTAALFFSENTQNLDSFKKENIKVNASFLNNARAKGAQLTIWLQAHGAPGWLYGARPDADDEFEGAKMFCAYVAELEMKTGLKVNNIVLNACHSATEIINLENGEYLNSPARLLSVLMPDKTIIGFTGKNSDARVRDIYKCNPANDKDYSVTDDDPEEINLSTVNGAVVFKDGKAIEYEKENNYYCNTHYMKPFILNSCGLSENKNLENMHFKICPAAEEVIRLREQGLIEGHKCYADNQMKAYQAAAKEMQARSAENHKQPKLLR